MSRRLLVSNFVLFQLCWFACVLGAAYQQPWLAFGLVVVVVGWQSWCATLPKQALLLILVVTVAGGALDQVMLNHRWVLYQAHGWSDRIVPIWILGLWMSFASTLNVSLRWIRPYPMTALLFGAIGGPLAYWAAQKLGAVVLPRMSVSVLTLGIGWGAMMLFLIKVAKRYDGYAHV